MSESTDEVATWASILGSVAAVLGLLQAQLWTTLAGIAFLSVAVFAGLYARTTRLRIESAGISIEGLNLDSLNIANLRRRLNRSLVVQRAYHLAKIEGRDLTVAWQYDGFCRAKRETSIEFSIDTDSNLPFDQLDCFAFDLKQDPHHAHRIRPLLVGGDGLSKKIAVPFLKALLYQQPFSILLNCTLAGSSAVGVQYYTSSLSFEQRRIDRLAVHLVFVRNAPKWVRVYECLKRGRPSLISEMRPFKDDGETCEYVDVLEDVPGQSIRIYVYQIGSPPLMREASDSKMLDWSTTEAD